MARAAERESALSRRKQPEMVAAAGFMARAGACVCLAREIQRKNSRRGGTKHEAAEKYNLTNTSIDLNVLPLCLFLLSSLSSFSLLCPHIPSAFISFSLSLSPLFFFFFSI